MTSGRSHNVVLSIVGCSRRCRLIQELSDWNAQAVSQSPSQGDPDLALCPLDEPDLGSGHRCELGQGFLCQTLLPWRDRTAWPKARRRSASFGSRRVRLGIWEGL